MVEEERVSCQLFVVDLKLELENSSPRVATHKKSRDETRPVIVATRSSGREREPTVGMEMGS